MGRRSCFAIAITIAIAICLAACRPAPTALPSATVAATVVLRPSARPTVTPRPIATSAFRSPISPLPAPTVTRTPLLSPTPMPQSAATHLPDLIWAKGVKPVVIERHIGQWSPTANEILLAYCSGSVTDTVSLAHAPDFAPIDVTPDGYACSPPSKVFTMLWTPDGQQIVLALPYVTSRGPTVSSASAALMDRHGNSVRPINDAVTLGRDLGLYGWVDDHTLVYDHYEGGGHHHIQAIDIRTGERVVDGGIIRGVLDYIGPGYLCASTYGDTYPAAVAIAPMTHTDEKDLSKGLPVHHFPADEPETEHVMTYCRGWQASTNRMLVLLARREPDQPFPSSSELVLWDVDVDAVSTLAPDGVSGRFAPDGRVVAYLTLGPAQLDAEKRPVPGHGDLSEIVTDLQDVIRYLQLLDLETGQVTLSLPTLDSSHFGYDQQYDEQVRSAFSPDSRYLAFFTPGEIESDAQGHPVGVSYDPWRRGYLNVLDVSTGQVIRSTPGDGMLPVWSHDSSRLVYRDEQGNLAVLDVAEGAVAPVTQGGGERIRNVHWSFDDRYLSLLIHDLGTHPSGTAILQVPLPVLALREPHLGVWLIPHPQRPESLTPLQLERETCIRDAAVVLATLRIVPATDETGGQE
jgi:hypothetical protein